MASAATDNDVKSRIERAAALLTEKDVGRHINHLLQVRVKNNPAFTLTESLESAAYLRPLVPFKFATRVSCFAYNTHKLTLIIHDTTSGTYPDGSSYEFGDLALVFDDVVVLKMAIEKEFRSHGSRFVARINENTIKKFRYGDWVNELAYLATSDDVFRELLEKNQREQLRRQNGPRIDFGDTR